MPIKDDIKFSIIVPVYNRPDEVKELLESLNRQTFKDFEVIIVDDGSAILCEKMTRDFMGQLNVKYFYKMNEGPGPSRNFGMTKATGNYFIILDSDVIVPDDYMTIISNYLQHNYIDAFGGPDEASTDFTPVQKAINFAMTSLWTTGGIRGKTKAAEKFHPRSFNMGLSKEVFEKTGGFSDMRYGEDIDLSIRIMKAGFKTILLPEAFVYHKRRNNFKSFFNQVKHSGEARIALYKKYHDSLKAVHFFPALFTIGLFLGIFLLAFNIKIIFYLYIFYFIWLSVAASLKYRNIKLGLFSAMASFVMLLGYGIGFLKAFLKSNSKN
jgi:GT2 family glycosyltransferase